jgi:hypothetical protein
MPDGVDITGIAVVPSNALALQAVVDHCTWDFDLIGTDAVSGDALAHFGRPSLMLHKKICRKSESDHEASDRSKDPEHE